MSNREAPLVSGLPILGSGLEMNNDLTAFLVKAYRQHGSIFRVRVPGREFVVLAGPSANVFASRHSAEIFRSFESWAELGKEFGSPHFMLSSDGEDLSTYRKAFKRGYSASLMTANIPLLLSIEQEVLSRTSGDVDMLDTLQQIVTEQLSQALTSHAIGEDITALRKFLHLALNVHVIGKVPRIALRSSSYRRAKARMFEIGRQIVQEHRDRQRDRADFIDDVLAAVEQYPDLLGEEPQLLAAVLGPYIAGLDTVANAANFLVFELLRNPDVKHQCQAEADRLFHDDTFDAEGAEVLRMAAMEALRLHPIAPGLTRTVTQDFEFEDYTVKAGSTVLVAMCVPHFLEECFQEPECFDLSRFLPPRNEHKQSGVYMPFGMGPHTCLGAGAAQVQMVTVAAQLLHLYDVEWAAPLPAPKIRPDPTLTLGHQLKVRLSAR